MGGLGVLGAEAPCTQARGFLEEEASNQGLTVGMGAMGPVCLILWLLTSVGYNKDDVLIQGLGRVRAWPTKLFHYVQGHLWIGEVRGWAGQVTSALSPPWPPAELGSQGPIGQPHTQGKAASGCGSQVCISHLQPDSELKATHLP